MDSRNRFYGGAILCIALVLSDNSFAQNSPPGTTNLSTVIVEASDAHASEAGPDNGTFTIYRRGGDSNASFNVFFRLGGTASNTVDYDTTSSNFVTFAAGASSAEVTITPIPDKELEGTETVALQLIPPPYVTPVVYYRIGWPSNAVVFIADNSGGDSNHAPTVRIVSPTNDSVFPAPADIRIFAAPNDSDGTVETVEFFANTTSLGIVTNNPFAASPINPWNIYWTNVPAGRYALRAKATDDKGATGWSDPVQITVGTPPPPQPVVNVIATDSDAEEIPVVPPGMGMPQRVNFGVFTISRTGNTNIPITVYFHLAGTASNGVDYTKVDNSATIPAGAVSTDVFIDPIDDFLVEGTESVVLRLEPIACIAIYPPPPDCYELGHSTSAVVYIRDNDSNTNTNLAPKVAITQPTNGASFVAPAKITIDAEVTDPDGYPTHVEFFANQHKIGEASIAFFVEPPPGQTVTLSMEWTNGAPGNYYLTARATDNQGGTGLSAPVRISIIGTNTPPPTNLPIVTIVASDSFASEGSTNVWTGTNTDPNTVWHSNVVNTATFIVRRSGPTNSDLVVSYGVSGSASNGVDYSTLPGTVTIAAGQRGAHIIVKPIDDQLPEPPETVVLTLEVPASPLGAAIPPPYVIGFPGRAAAVIADNDSLRPPTRCLSDGLFHACFPGTNGYCYRLEFSADLSNWTSVCTNAVTDGFIHFIDPDNTRDVAHRFYRAVPEPCPAAE